MKQGAEAYPALRAKFEKAKEGLLRETKNYRLDAPYEVASYNSRLILEESVWYLEDYVREMEGEYAEKYPMTMEECAMVAQESLTGRHKVEALAMGNIDETEARKACQIVEDHLFSNKQSRALEESEIPTFRSMQLPTREEAKHIFGEDVVATGNRSVPLVYQELAFSPSEENHAIELIIQTGSEIELEYDGVALLELFAWNESDFLTHTEGSAIRRIGHDRWQRNIAVALGNADHSDAIIQALERAKDDASALLAEHIDWALAEQYSKAPIPV